MNFFILFSFILLFYNINFNKNYLNLLVLIFYIFYLIYCFILFVSGTQLGRFEFRYQKNYREEFILNNKIFLRALLIFNFKKYYK